MYRGRQVETNIKWITGGTRDKLSRGVVIDVDTAPRHQETEKAETGALWKSPLTAFALLLGTVVMGVLVACGGQSAEEREGIRQELQILAERWEQLAVKVTFRSTLPTFGPEGEKGEETGTMILYLGPTTGAPTSTPTPTSTPAAWEEVGLPLLGLTGKLWRLDFGGQEDEGGIIIAKGDVVYACSQEERSCTSELGDAGLGLIPWGPLLGGPQNFMNLSGLGLGVKQSDRLIAGQGASCFSAGKLEACYTPDAIPLAYTFELSGSTIELEATSFTREVSEADFELPYPAP